ncbi:unnamed protein product [Polarella glacialis]|nr:unnamed protein product [Polarella glacialis]
MIQELLEAENPGTRGINVADLQDFRESGAGPSIIAGPAAKLPPEKPAEGLFTVDSNDADEKSLLAQSLWQKRKHADVDKELQKLLGGSEVTEALVSAIRLWPPIGQAGYSAICRSSRGMKDLAEHPHSALAWREAFQEAGDGTSMPDMPAIRGLRKLIWLQTEKAIRCSLAGDPTPHLPALDLAQPAPSTERMQLGPAVQGAAPATQGTWQADAARREPPCEVRVMERDILEEAGELVAKGLKVAVLNMASAGSPGGGYLEGAGAQEENLHRRSDACRFTAQQRRNYPIPEDACLLSRLVTVFRGPEKAGYPFLEQPFKVAMVSCAAISNPRLDRKRMYEDPRAHNIMKLKIALIIDAAVKAGCNAVVLSAFGCGAFGNPPEVVAGLFRDELQRSRICSVVFCIFDDHNAMHSHNPHGNIVPFREAFRLQ